MWPLGWRWALLAWLTGRGVGVRDVVVEAWRARHSEDLDDVMMRLDVLIESARGELPDVLPAVQVVTIMEGARGLVGAVLAVDDA